MAPETKCRDCKHEYKRHYQDFGGMEGCGQGTMETTHQYDARDYDEVCKKCLCHGFAVGMSQLGDRGYFGPG